MKKIVFILILIVVFICGCTSNHDQNDDNLYKGIASAEIPEHCIEFKDDICGLFDCMVDTCWCDDAHYPSPVLYEPTGIDITNEEDAMNIVKDYLELNNSEYKEYSDVKRAVKLNSVFYNVFAEDADEDEMTFVVAVDGTILKTICGV